MIMLREISPLVTILVVSAIAVYFGLIMLGLIWIANRVSDGWKRRHTYQFVTFCLVIVSVVVAFKGTSHWHRQQQTQKFARMLSTVEPTFLRTAYSIETVKPGVLWFGASYAPSGFKHGTAWCRRFKTEGYTIFTLALENPAVVYVDVYDDNTLDAVYVAEVRKDCFPSIPRNDTPREPTVQEKKHYASIAANYHSY